MEHCACNTSHTHASHTCTQEVGTCHVTTNATKWKGFFPPMSVEVTYNFRTSIPVQFYVIWSILSCHTRTDEKSYPAEILTEAHLLLTRSLGYDLKGEINRIRNELPNTKYHRYLGRQTHCWSSKNCRISMGFLISFIIFNKKKNGSKASIFFFQRLRWISYYFRYNLDTFSPQDTFSPNTSAVSKIPGAPSYSHRSPGWPPFLATTNPAGLWTMQLNRHGRLVGVSHDTVDGRNPAPADMVNIPLFTGFYTSQVVVWDFWTINSRYPSRGDVYHRVRRFFRPFFGSKPVLNPGNSPIFRSGWLYHLWRIVSKTVEGTNLQPCIRSGQIVIFHQVAFSWNSRGFLLLSAAFGGPRSCDVAII